MMYKSNKNKWKIRTSKFKDVNEQGLGLVQEGPSFGFLNEHTEIVENSQLEDAIDSVQAIDNRTLQRNESVNEISIEELLSDPLYSQILGLGDNENEKL